MSADVILTHFNQLFCPNDLGHPLYGKEMAEANVSLISVGFWVPSLFHVSFLSLWGPPFFCVKLLPRRRTL